MHNVSRLVIWPRLARVEHYIMSGAHREDVAAETPTEQKPLREVESHHEAHDESHRAADAGCVVDPTQPEMYPQRPRAYPHMEPPLALAQRRPAEPVVAGEVFGCEPLERARDGT